MVGDCPLLTSPRRFLTATSCGTLNCCGAVQDSCWHLPVKLVPENRFGQENFAGVRVRAVRHGRTARL